MAFPLSISGVLKVRMAAVTPAQPIIERLRAALAAQTVDMIKVSGHIIEFRPQIKRTADRPRPEGKLWMFEGIGPCFLHVHHDQNHAVIKYNLDFRLQFSVVIIFSAVTGALIRSSSAPGHDWGWTVAGGIWGILFLSSYISKAIEFRQWLRNNLTSDEQPPTKRMRVPISPD